MNTIFSYVLEFAPIFVGASIFVIIKSVKLIGKKVIVDGSHNKKIKSWPDVRTKVAIYPKNHIKRYDDIFESKIFAYFNGDLIQITQGYEQSRSWNGFVGIGDDLKLESLKRINYDKSIVFAKTPEEKAFMMSDLYKKHRKMNLFSSDEEYRKAIFTFKPLAGYILAYSIGYELNIIGDNYSVDN